MRLFFKGTKKRIFLGQKRTPSVIFLQDKRSLQVCIFGGEAFLKDKRGLKIFKGPNRPQYADFYRMWILKKQVWILEDQRGLHFYDFLRFQGRKDKTNSTTCMSRFGKRFPRFFQYFN